MANLKEILPQFDGYDIKVSLGTSFVYCDTYSDKTASEIEFQSDYELNRLHKMLEKNEKQQKAIQKVGFRKYAEKKWLSECAKIDDYNYDPDNIDRTKKEYPDEEDFIECMRVKYDKLKSSIRTTRRRIKEFKPFLECEVIETRDAIRPNTKIIVCKGDIVGDFWDVDEYRDRDKNGRCKSKYKLMG